MAADVVPAHETPPGSVSRRTGRWDADAWPTESAHTGLLLAVLGTIGLAASLILTHDKVETVKAAAQDEAFTTNCDLNAFVSCSAIISSPESEAFGFLNSFMGIIGFTVVLLLGMTLVLGGTWPRLFTVGLQAGASLAIAFVTWLQVQSIYDIGKLCPYCMAVWAVTIPIFVLSTRRFLQLLAPHHLLTRCVSNWTLLIVLTWYVAIASAVWFTFGENLWI